MSMMGDMLYNHSAKANANCALCQSRCVVRVLGLGGQLPSASLLCAFLPPVPDFGLWPR